MLVLFSYTRANDKITYIYLSKKKEKLLTFESQVIEDTRDMFNCL